MRKQTFTFTLKIDHALYRELYGREDAQVTFPIYFSADPCYDTSFTIDDYEAPSLEVISLYPEPEYYSLPFISDIVGRKSGILNTCGRRIYELDSTG